MDSDSVAIQLINSIRILQYVKERGEKGAELREIWSKLRQIDSGIPPACVVSQMNRRVKENHLAEVKMPDPHGYLRRFYDPKYEK